MSSGGKRAGAGRKCPAGQQKQTYTFRLSPTAAEVLKQQPNRSQFIERLINEHKERLLLEAEYLNLID